MSLFFSGFGLGDLGNTTVRLGKVSLTMMAEKGGFSTSKLPIDDPAGSIIPLALKPCNVAEWDSATTERLWTGYSVDRGVARGSGDSLRLAAARRWDGTLADANSNLNFDVLSGAGWNRPAESVTARLAYLLASTPFSARVVDSGHVIGSALLLSPADYRGQFPKNVLDDCAERVGYNYFVYFDPTAHTDSLGFFSGSAYTGLSSTLRFTNVAADVDNTTTFAASGELDRDPSEVYSKIVLQWKGGYLTKTNTTTSSLFGIRGAFASKDNITTLTHADAWADQFLDDHSNETDTITVTTQIPRAYINSVFAGQRAQIKFTHLDQYTSYTYVRIVSCTKAQDEETDQHMTVTLEMRNPKSTHASGSGGGPPPPMPFPGGTVGSVGIVNGFCGRRGAGWTFPFAPVAGHVLLAIFSYRNQSGALTGISKNPGPVDDGWTVLYPDTSLSGLPSFGVAVKISDGNENSNTLVDVGAGTSTADACFYELDATSLGQIGTILVFTSVGDPGTWGTGAIAGSNNDTFFAAWANDTDPAGSGYQGDLTAGWITDYRSPSGSAGINDWPQTLIAHAFGGPSSPTVTFCRIGCSPFPTNIAAIGLAVMASGDFTPGFGQQITDECQNGNGTTVTFTTAYPYIPGSLKVRVDGVQVINGLTETSPTAGTFTLDFAPLGAIGDSAAEQVCYDYQAGTT